MHMGDYVEQPDRIMEARGDPVEIRFWKAPEASVMHKQSKRQNGSTENIRYKR